MDKYQEPTSPKKRPFVMGSLRVIIGLLFCGLVSIASSQGGQGGSNGFGFGGSQGGGSFGQGGPAYGQSTGYSDQEMVMRRSIFPGKRNESEEIQNWSSKSLILTPGDKVETKFTAKKGQVVFATVESDAFDPAMTVVDSDGKVLTENDDQYEGEQAPYVSFVVKHDGEYKLVVRNYRSTSGGRFNLRTKMVTCVTPAPGNNLLELPKGTINRGQEFYISIEAEKGKYYGLLHAPRVVKGNTISPYFQRLIGPSGVPELDQEDMQAVTGDFVFLAKQSGTYLLRCGTSSYSGEGPWTFGVCFDEIGVDKIGIDGEATVNLLPGRQRILQYEVKVGTALRSKVILPQFFEEQLNIPKPKPNNQGSTNSLIWVPIKSNDASDGLRFFPGEGTVSVVICNSSSESGTYKITNSTKFPALKLGAKETDKLGIGEAKVYSFTGKKMEIQRIVAQSSQMEVTMDLIQDDLRRWQYQDSGNHRPMAVLNFDEPHTFVMTVSSAGRGGSGEYSLEFSSIKPTPIKVGSAVTVTESEGLSTVYEVTLEKGTNYHMVGTSATSNVSIADPEGVNVQLTYFLVPGGSRFFRATKDGNYRMRFYGSAKGGKFKIEKLVTPVID